MCAACTIAFEGSDGAGKATQTDLLVEFLQSKGLKIARVSFPRYNQTLGGTLLHEVMKGPRADSYRFSKEDPYVGSLLYTMDRIASRKYLEELIATHDYVLFDRYVESNLLHQGGKLKTNEERLEFGRWLFELEYGMLKLPTPQKVVYLTIPFWLSRARAKKREASGGEKVDAVEKDIKYVKAGHEGGLFYAKLYGWITVEGVEEGRELSALEIHDCVKKQLGFQ